MNPRKVHTSCGVTDFLQKSGLLENGTKKEILRAKKTYWAAKRTAWQQQKRKVSKSYTVLFTQTEYKEIAQAAKDRHASITIYIKQSALHRARRSQGIDTITIGKVREAFFEAYNTIEEAQQTQFIHLENKILTLLRS